LPKGNYQGPYASSVVALSMMHVFRPSAVTVKQFLKAICKFLDID
jgi:hypothetical protein